MVREAVRCGAHLTYDRLNDSLIGIPGPTMTDDAVTILPLETIGTSVPWFRA